MSDEEKCIVYNCDEPADWVIGYSGSHNFAYCNKHKYWGEFVRLVLQEAKRNDRSRGSSIINSEDIDFEDEDRINERIKKWKKTELKIQKKKEDKK